MRLNLKLTGNTEPVPFDHLHKLTGTIHKWLGAGNDLHDTVSLYSFSWLDGGVKNGNALHFPRGAGWRVSFHKVEAAKQMIDGLMQDPTVACGMRAFEVEEQATPAFSGCYRFLVDSPVVTRRRREDGGHDYLLYDDKASDETLTRTLRYKLEEAGYDGEHLEASVQFDRTYANARTKLATIKGIKHKGSECPVVVTGTPEAVQFAWKVGVGELTGSGFGALK